jgi:enoyl-CoA hydratase/carnithine racemase
MTYEDIVVTREQSWIEISINRREKLNSLREKTAEEILGLLADVELDRTVKAVILAGNDKAFCIGTDTSEFLIPEDGHFDFYRFRKRARRSTGCSANSSLSPSR